jgi:Flp pilus assembly protein CpaB
MNAIFKGRWTIWIMALTFALLAGFGTLTLIGSASQRVNYFVVSENVAARTEITAANVVSVSVTADAIPPTALTEEQVASGEYYTKIALSKHTVLTGSVVTKGLDALGSQLKDGYVMASLLVTPENAAGGRIAAGDYVDIAALSGSDANATAKIALHHVLVLDVTVSADTVANNAANASATTGASANSTTAGPSSPALYGGIPQLYTFAVTPDEFTKLALIRDSKVYLALTKASATAPVDASANGSSVFTGGAVQSSTGSTGSSTDSAATKTEVESFFKVNKATSTMKVVKGALVAYDKAGNVVESIDLAGGTIDLTTGVYTPASN